MTNSLDSLHYLRDLVRRRSAIVLEEDKNYLVENRLDPVIRQHKLGSLEELLAAAKRNEGGPVARSVIEAMTTNETSFFRDIHPWETLRTAILPDLVARRRESRRLRIWCAAASTGQEPYTIAMVIREYFPELASWDVEILGTDLNTTVLQRARDGVYKQLEVNRGMPPALLSKYFEPKGTDWAVKPELKRIVTFRELNLLDRWSLLSSASDVVFMRNVLIYFESAVKKDILSRVHTRLAGDGYLVLGGAETTLNLDDRYVPVRAGQTVVYQPRGAATATVAP